MEEARQQMVRLQLIPRNIDDPAVLHAMATVPRELFIPEELRLNAYEDGPLPIGWGQTISQPYIVALMTQSAQITSSDRVLEVGTGSGYQAAVLAELGAEVFTIECIHELAERARELLEQLAYDNIHCREGDGSLGWHEEAPYDAILTTAAAAEIPQHLLEQLKEGGRLVIPVGNRFEQELLVVTKSEDGHIVQRSLGGVRFVPLVGEEGV